MKKLILITLHLVIINFNLYSQQNNHVIAMNPFIRNNVVSISPEEIAAFENEFFNQLNNHLRTNNLGRIVRATEPDTIPTEVTHRLEGTLNFVRNQIILNIQLFKILDEYEELLGNTSMVIGSDTELNFRGINIFTNWVIWRIFGSDWYNGVNFGLEVHFSNTRFINNIGLTGKAGITFNIIPNTPYLFGLANISFILNILSELEYQEAMFNFKKLENINLLGLELGIGGRFPLQKYPFRLAPYTSLSIAGNWGSPPSTVPTNDAFVFYANIRAGIALMLHNCFILNFEGGHIRHIATATMNNDNNIRENITLMPTWLIGLHATIVIPQFNK